MKISIAWGDLELDEAGSPNESFLAAIRKQLKEGHGGELEFRLDGESAPPWVRDKLPRFAEDPALQDRFLDAAAHCARRLKNCGIGTWTLACAFGEAAPAFISRLTERLSPYIPGPL